MLPQRQKSVTRLHPEKSDYRKQKQRQKAVADRRSGIDRRQSVDNRYFLNGGVERRSWKERRYLWYMTE
ncbi:MAG: hypothetical protein PVG35_09925 [Desulfobacterales bacterium]|jgi:hypothetical protein